MMDEIPREAFIAPVRLAFRVEGEFVNAYLARVDTMDGKILLSALRFTMANQHPSLFGAWKDALTRWMNDEIERVTGSRPKTTAEVPGVDEVKRTGS